MVNISNYLKMNNLKILQARCSISCIVMKILNDLKINFNIHGDHLFLDRSSGDHCEARPQCLIARGPFGFDTRSVDKTGWISLLCGGGILPLRADSYLHERKAYRSSLVSIAPSAAVETFLGKYMMTHHISSDSSVSASVREELALDQGKELLGKVSRWV